MPSAKILEEKKQIVNQMTERLKSKSGVFVDYKGITVIEDTEMRVKLREAGVDYSVVRNRLMKFAVKNVGFDALESMLVGTTSLATSDEDPIAPARIIKEFADKLPEYFEIKAGFMDGKILSVDEVNAIASIPALPVLQAQFLGTLLAPITGLAVVLKAAAEKGGGVVDAEAPAEAAPAAEATTEAPAEAAPAAEAVTEAPAKAAPAAEAAATPAEEKE
ncbi:MAG: 50S ribosomal protein L10 [Oscillospiraceae bacterium]|nr:50S ribosomal protein L10 [Oscillospiraceae bacterium]